MDLFSDNKSALRPSLKADELGWNLGLYLREGGMKIDIGFCRFVPPLDPKKPTDISMGFDNFEILKIDDKDFTVEVNVYLIVKWKDSRIIINFAEVYWK